MSVVLLARFGEELGISAGEATRGTGVDLAVLGRPDALVTAGQELGLVENLVRHLPRDAQTGLEVGMRYRITTFGIWGWAIVSAATLREAIGIGRRFADLSFALSDPEIEEDSSEVRLVLTPPPVETEVSRFIEQRDTAGVQALQRDLFGFAVPLARVTFQHQPGPEGIARYVETYGVEPEFGAERTMLVFDPTLLDLPLPQADEHTTAMAQEQCRRLLDERHARKGVAGQVRDLIIARLQSPPSESDVAAHLHLAERTLRRRLAEEGTSMRALVGEVRATVSAELLRTGLTVSEIAHRLGYLEVSSFSQAFRRWHGVSPRAFRAAH